MGTIRLRTLGSLDLVQEDGTPSVRSVLTRPKRLAVLVYLAAAHPSADCSRDTLLGLLWPELDGPHARKALRQSLYELRQALGSGVLTGKGTERIGVDPERIWCDARAFSIAAEAGRDEEALELYRGPFLDGFHVSGAPAFERWVEDQRRRLGARARAAVWRLEEAAARTGDRAGVRRWGERALELAPYDEAGLRRHLIHMWELGQPAVAIRAFERYAERVANDLELEPSAETLALVQRIRRDDPGGGANRSPDRESAGSAPDRDAVGPDRGPGRASAGRLESSPPAAAASRDRDGSSVAPARESRTGPLHRLVRVAAVAVLLVLVGLAPGLLVGGGSGLEARRVVVAPLENRTHDASFDVVGRIAADWIVQGLARTDVADAVPSVLTLGALAQLENEHDDHPPLGRARALAGQFGAGTLVVGGFHRRADELEFQAQVIDVGSGRLLAAIDGIRGDADDPLAAIDELRRRTLGAVGFQLDERIEPIMAEAHRPPSYEAYLAFATGLGHRQRFEWRQSVSSFRRAFALDTTFVPALFMAALDHLNLGELARSDSLIQRLAGHREQLSSVERLLLRWAEANIQGDTGGALDAIRRLAEYSDVFRPQVAFDALRANRPRTAIQAYQGLPIDSFPKLWQLAADRRLTSAHHRLARFDGELAVARRAKRRHPDRAEPVLWEARALIGMGRIRAARQMLEEALDMGSARDWVPGELLLRVSDELRAHGHPDAGRDLLPRALAWYRALPDSLAVLPTHRRHHATVLLRSDSLGAAEAAFQRLTDEFPDDLFYRASLAVIRARRGEVAEARRIAASLEPTAPYQFGYYRYEQARIAAELGDTDEAMTLLEDAIARGYDLAFDGGSRGPEAARPPAGSPHLDPAFAALRTHPAFQALWSGGA